ncbi:ABC transporter substrate-binding protein [Amorphus orientalis]|uniref:Trehalose/maltose transport system substrate-binding protein n=1 Tax=Amorphus orientalis TaxID=649198 RepID=A0AAE3VLI7_9HYPH|nr:ABC transporter substrate-binding protein [Amorphus orientalis]MDQ0314153.1 trehalose/maltose transport system substrate-binding protein [Amorphus orientalis]
MTLACGAVGIEYEDCKTSAELWAEQTGNTVLTFPMPNDPEARLGIYEAVIRDGTGKIDVFLIDVVWPGLLADALMDLTPYLADEANAHFPSIIANNTVGGELKAMPMFMDTGLLYFRSDLLSKYGFEVPQSWEDLVETARVIQSGERAAGRLQVSGLVFQGRDYEGLTCSALEWIAGSGGGRIVGPDGTVTIENDRAIAALDRAAGWIGDIVPEAVLDFDEEEARYTFQEGNAVFMRNWPYAWTLLNSPMSAVAGSVGIAPLPHEGDGAPAAALGGWQLGVSRDSANPEAAADLVRYLTSARLQKDRAIEASYAPTRPALYEDPDLVARAPFLAALQGVQPVARPSTVTGRSYDKVSEIFRAGVHDVLAGETNAASAAAKMRTELEAIRGDGW